MGILKIRQIWDRTCEREPVLVGIDYFDELDKMAIEQRQIEELKSRKYYMATVGVLSTGSINFGAKAEFSETSAFHKRGSVPYYMHKEDEYSPPSIKMYIALGQSLKRENIVFNKKKCRFQRKGEN